MIEFNRKLSNFKTFLGLEVWNLFLLATVLGVLWFIAESGFVIILQSFLMSLGVMDKDKTMLPGWFPSDVWATSLILVGFGLFRGLVVAMKYYFAVATGQSFIRYQKSQILEIGLRNAPNMSTAEIITAYSDHTGAAAVALQHVAQLINNMVSIVLFIGAGFYLAPKEFVLSLVLLGFVLLPIVILNRSLGGLSNTIFQERDVANKIMIDGLKNNFFLQIYHLIGSEVQKGALSLKAYENAYKKYGRIGGIRASLPQTLGAIVVAIVTYVSINYFHTPGGMLLSFFYVFIRLSQCASDFYSVSGDIKMQIIGLRTLYNWNLKLKEFENQHQVKEVCVPAENLSRIRITATNLNFSYGTKNIIKDINFQLVPGEVLLIRGESGAGKSTLLSLVLGLINPSEGSITINSFPPSSIRTSLAKQIGYVGPEPFLIAGSVRDNLLYGHPDPSKVSDELIWSSLEKAQLRNEIESLSRRLDENLLERTQFSTGQKQRLSIARALARNPSILVLDEATANLDSDTESRFISLLSTLTPLMTTVIVSHKDSFNDIATKLITLEKSKEIGATNEYRN